MAFSWDDARVPEDTPLEATVKMLIDSAPGLADALVPGFDRGASSPWDLATPSPPLQSPLLNEDFPAPTSFAAKSLPPPPFVAMPDACTRSPLPPPRGRPMPRVVRQLEMGVPPPSALGACGRCFRPECPGADVVAAAVRAGAYSYTRRVKSFNRASGQWHESYDEVHDRSDKLLPPVFMIYEFCSWRLQSTMVLLCSNCDAVFHGYDAHAASLQRHLGECHGGCVVLIEPIDFAMEDLDASMEVC